MTSERASACKIVWAIKWWKCLWYQTSSLTGVIILSAGRSSASSYNKWGCDMDEQIINGRIIQTDLCRTLKLWYRTLNDYKLTYITNTDITTISLSCASSHAKQSYSCCCLTRNANTTTRLILVCETEHQAKNADHHNSRSLKSTSWRVYGHDVFEWTHAVCGVSFVMSVPCCFSIIYTFF